MTYRVNASTCEDVNLDHELRTMAARGRAQLNDKAARAAKAQQIAEAKAARKQARQAARERRKQAAQLQARAARSCHWLGFFGSPNFRLYWFGFSAWLLPSGLAALILMLTTNVSWLVYAAVAAASALLPTLALFIVAALSRRTLRREQAWVETLPFSLHGHLWALGAEHEGQTRVQITFRRGAPTRELLRDLLAGAGLLASVDTREALESGDPRALVFRLPTSSELGVLCHDNYGYRSWMRRLAALLTRLHQLHPLAELRMGRSG